ncbi:ankyrin repeat-containing domain protein [Aspergillus stella-maris]|uniref:ankyrin repeat-containing domain protein n=1 Tax=Aspergillus stella-maris TaxID=1810926 RepID=UPI003CCCFA24
MFNLASMFSNTPHTTRPPGLQSALQQACQSGDPNAVRRAAATAERDELTAALHRACGDGKIAVIEMLLEDPETDINTTFEGKSTLFVASQSCEPDVIRLLLDRGAAPTILSSIDTHPRSREPKGLPPLHAISRQRRLMNARDPDTLENTKHSVSLLLQAGCDINARDSHGDTVLHQVLHRKIPLVDFLLEQGADPNATNERGETPMHMFLDVGNQPLTLGVLMNHGARLDIQNTTTGRTPLHEYAASKQLRDLSLFYEYVTDWTVTDSEGNTLLHTVAKHHHVGDSTLRELLEIGLSHNQRNNHGYTPLHLLSSSTESLADGLDILCAAGANIEAQDNSGRTPLTRIMDPQESSVHEYYQGVKVFIDKGANLNAQDYQGNNILQYLVNDLGLKVDLMNVLLSLGAKPTLPNYNGDTFLHSLCARVATYQDDKGVLAIRSLIHGGASATSKNHKGQTPLHLLCSRVSQHYFAPTAVSRISAIDVMLDAGLIDNLNTPDYDGVLPIHNAATISEVLVGKLMSRGADTTLCTKDGRNLLHIASTARQSNAVGLLIDHYASIGHMDLVNRQCKNGRTPLHEGCRSGRIETISLLLDAGADVNAAKIRDVDGKGLRPLDACLEFGEELALWESSEDQKNLFHEIVTGGILSSDETRPREPKRKVQKKRSLSSEVASENNTVSIAPIIRLLVSRGAKLESGRQFSRSLIEDARRAGLEDAVIELEALMEKEAPPSSRYADFELEYMKLRSDNLPALLDRKFQTFFSHYDATHLILHRHFDELAGALEKNFDPQGPASEDRLDRALSHTLVICARYGYYDMFKRIGGLMREDSWINHAEGSLKETLLPYLLAASHRSLPNLEVIKVMVEIFKADVNKIFTEGMKLVPEVFFCSQVDAARKYKPGDTVLHYLAQSGHWWHRAAIKYLIEKGADVNFRNKQGKTPLCHAVASGHLGGYGQRDITKILLDGGADPNIAASCGWTPLGMAAHDNELVKLLLQHGARPSTEHPMEIFNALGSFNNYSVESFLMLGIDINTTILSDAQPHWHTWRVRKIPNQPQYILPPLHYISMACFNETHTRDHATKMIKYLLSRGADPYLLVDGERPIVHKVFSEDGIIQPYLEIADLDLERRDGIGRTLLLAAACSPCGTESYNFEVSLLPSMDQQFHPAYFVEDDKTRAMTLYERGADITAVDNAGNNVVHWLVHHPCAGRRFMMETNYRDVAHQKTIEALLEKGPQLASQKNDDGDTPLDIATRMKHQWAIDVLSRSQLSQEPQT